MLFSVEQVFVGRDKIRAPLKMPAWETKIRGDTCYIAHLRKRTRSDPIFHLYNVHNLTRFLQRREGQITKS